MAGVLGQAGKIPISGTNQIHSGNAEVHPESGNGIFGIQSFCPMKSEDAESFFVLFTPANA